MSDMVAARLEMDESAIERALSNLFAAERKTLLIGLYCAELIEAEQVAFWFYVYGLSEA